MMIVKVAVPIPTEKDYDELHALLDARTGTTSSFDHPPAFPGFLVVTVHSDTITQNDLRAHAEAAIAAAGPPKPFVVPFDAEELRRVLAKQAQGKPLSTRDLALLARAETE